MEPKTSNVVSAKPKVQKRREIRLQESVRSHLEDYCQSTSIHGVQYLGQRDRYMIERISWLLVFAVCLLGNFNLIRQLWKKWHASPVMVTFAETTTAIWQIPFPALTVCSEQKVRATVFNFTKFSHISTKKRDDVTLLCNDDVFFNSSSFVDESAIENIIEVSPSYDDTILTCKWKRSCEDIFKASVTEQGFCLTFNMLPPDKIFRGQGIPGFESNLRQANWTIDTGYPRYAPIETYPERTLFPGTKSGLTVILKASKNDTDFTCNGPEKGFRALLHNPAEIPAIGDLYLRVPLNKEVILSVKPKMMRTSEDLRPYHPEIRQCFFSEERFLAYFKIYTQRNCDLECRTNYTLKSCGCVAYYMPRNSKTKICGSAKKPCVTQSLNDLKHSAMKSYYESKTLGSCNCLPACNSLEYDAEISQANFNVMSVVGSREINQSLAIHPGDEFVSLIVSFKNKQFMTRKRIEIFGFGDFFANCGGLLGLFCGISFLSIVELVYYMTLRLWNNLKPSKLSKKEDATVPS